ncbi:hypothetical protein [Pseudomonas oryzihabitans]|uniref:hypothetical protein n=1 Tax=Pseudomonas oryzihabitans TaxID=47885 RepID=UPI001123D2DE|nr:hypothetical protein [Pseudomonas psychrotolerans]
MKNIAKNEANLKKRIIRFFDGKSNGRPELSCFIEELLPIGDVLLFGGTLRDIALYGTKKFKSDIDLVIDTNPESLKILIENLDIKCKKNRYGGYRTAIGEWEVDLWPISETWAFKNNKVKLNDKKSLIKTTLTNWDAIAYSFLENKIICKESYFSEITEGLLDVILTENNDEISAIVRVLRSIYDKEAKKLTPRATAYVSESLKKWNKELIFKHQIKTFHKNYFSIADLEALDNRIGKQQISLLDEDLEQIQDCFNFK